MWCWTTCDHSESETLFYPANNWLLGYNYDSPGLAMWCIGPTCNISLLDQLGDPEDALGLLTIDRVALDETGGLLAVAFRQGIVRVYGFQGPANLDVRYRLELGNRTFGPLRKVDAITFDPTGSWLAMLRSEQLQLWELRSSQREPSLVTQVESAKKLAFDRSSTVLIVGTNRSLLFFELSSGKLLASYPTPTVTSIALSPDGRLVLWGDAEGTIHIWGYQE
jgi:WD40 repeat protein